MTTIERTTRGRHRHWRRDRQAVSSARLHLTRRARRRPQPPRSRPFAIVRTRLPHPSVSPAPPFSDNRTDDLECPNIARRRHRDRVSLSLSLSISPFFSFTREDADDPNRVPLDARLTGERDAASLLPHYLPAIGATRQTRTQRVVTSRTRNDSRDR